ncbi:hypothetical protein [Maritimibacter fusiformis]|uniref:HTH marR-type domain-containing protein n=1 Tax=Maritimibacter fusiformis TaxID=2603819 RepID=A0A5D0RLP3_9RHOB|nr:hypothetical protein [Maritimibacter fusiformis]TYB82432.1 hypothetical protein FVF75_06875 [Maritimibacter fusiformis]
MTRTSRVEVDLGRGIRFLQRLAQYDLNMQLSTALTLLYIAQHQNRPEGVTTMDLTRNLGLTQGAASRNGYYWGEGTPDMPNAGYGLVTQTIDTKDRRRRLLTLTPRGEAFVRQLEEVLYG